jgi:biotin carboxyl carrier protein
VADVFKTGGKRVKLEAPKGVAWKFTTRPGGWILAERAREDGSVERRRFALSEMRGKLGASLQGILYFGEVTPETHGSGGTGGSESDLMAQFPGKVRKLIAQAGEVVEEGAPLLMVEAMKMEFPVKAPYAGKVTRILVSEGQQLSPGDRFLELEPLSG